MKVFDINFILKIWLKKSSFNIFMCSVFINKEIKFEPELSLIF